MTTEEQLARAVAALTAIAGKGVKVCKSRNQSHFYQDKWRGAQKLAAQTLQDIGERK